MWSSLWLKKCATLLHEAMKNKEQVHSFIETGSFGEVYLKAVHLYVYAD